MCVMFGRSRRSRIQAHPVGAAAMTIAAAAIVTVAKDVVTDHKK
jgi:hypothetical protein